MRNPILTITYNDLATIMASIMPDSLPAEVDAVVYRVFEVAKLRPSKIANIDSLKAKGTIKKVARSVKADADLPKGAVELFHRLYIGLTASSYSKKVTAIREDSPQYLTLKEITRLAYMFCQSYDLEMQKGFTYYITTGARLMGRPMLSKYKYYDPKISEGYDCIQQLEHDPNTEATYEYSLLYKSIFFTYSNGMDIYQDIEKDPSKYAHMLFGRLQADANKADYEDWITAQFEGLTYLNSLPELTQFYGEQATLRYERYLKENTAQSNSVHKDAPVSMTDIYKNKNIEV